MAGWIKRQFTVITGERRRKVNGWAGGRMSGMYLNLR